MKKQPVHNETPSTLLTSVSRRQFLGFAAGSAAAGYILGTEDASAKSMRRRFTSSWAYPIVETADGKLRGRNRGGVTGFEGVHYGATTAAAHRFLPPRPPIPWTGVRDALTFGDQCPQINPDYPAWVDSSPASEDCLVLNVYTPDSSNQSSKLPVMVWIHGGGYTYGSASSQLYNGHSLAKSGNVVVVGINHRLNVFGYTYLSGHTDERVANSGNVGLLDIVAALRWVRDNIERFGGDRGNITLFGESGGGGKISALLGMPSAQGLFHKAIVESGSIIRVRDPGEATELTDKMYRALGIRVGDITALQKLPAKTLLAWFNRASAASLPSDAPLGPLLVGPVADGETIPRQPWEGTGPELSRGIPMIIGTNLHESVLFVPELSGPIADDRSLAAKISKSAALVGVAPEELMPLLHRYRQVMPRLNNTELLVRISTDIGFWSNALKQAELKLHEGSARVYMYQCDWKTPCFGGMWAPHGVEIPFVFDVKQYGVAWDGKDSDALRNAADPQHVRFRVGSQMLAAWTNFARSGDPSTAELHWAAYETKSRPTMIFDGTSREVSSRMVNDPRSAVRPGILSLQVRQHV